MKSLLPILQNNLNFIDIFVKQRHIIYNQRRLNMKVNQGFKNVIYCRGVVSKPQEETKPRYRCGDTVVIMAERGDNGGREAFKRTIEKMRRVNGRWEYYIKDYSHKGEDASYDWYGEDSNSFLCIVRIVQSRETKKKKRAEARILREKAKEMLCNLWKHGVSREDCRAWKKLSKNYKG